MEFLGNKYLSISYQTGLSFELDISTNNINSTCNLGFTGENKNLNFKFESGKIYDPENRLVSFYSSGENINISGDISPQNYSYYINDNLLCLNGKKDNFIISGYYLNTPSSIVNTDIVIQGTRPQYELFLSPVFYITGTSFLTGSINNANNLNFRIYSGSVNIPSNFSIQNLSEFVYDTGYFEINTYNATSGQLEDERLYEVQLNLFTNFGQIIQNFTTTGSYSGFLNINLNLDNITDFFSRTGIQTGLGDFKNNDYSLIYDITSGSIRSAQINLDKYINIELKYYSGYTGQITGNLLATGYANIALTGFVNGSGFLNGSLPLAMTGYHALSGVNVTGFITGTTSQFTFFTGFSNFNFNIPTTGYYLSRIITGNRDFNLNAFTSTGIIDYNNYIQNVFPIKVETFPTGLTGSFGQFISANELGNLVLVSNTNSINANNSTGLVYVFTGNKINWRNEKILSGLAGDKYFGQNIISRNGDRFFVTSKRGSLLNNTGISGRVYTFTNYNEDINNIDYLEKSGNFGNSLAVNSGNILSVGANFADGGSGAAFIFRSIFLTGYYIGSTISATGVERFGTSIDVSKNEKVIIVGSPQDSASVSQYGAAWILTGNNNSYARILKISGENNQSSIGVGFGRSVAINENATVGFIGEPFYSGNDSIQLGRVFIITGNQNNWITGNTLTGDIGARCFGNSLKINDYGNIGLIGASPLPEGQVLTSMPSGQVWIVTGSGRFWRTRQKLSGTIGITDISFGSSVSLNKSGNIIVVGQHLDSSLTPNRGSIYVYTGNNFTWAFANKINSPFAQSSMNFGKSIDLNSQGNIIAVGSPGFASSKGAVFTYTGSGNNWINTASLSGQNSFEEFGSSVSLNSSGNILCIGAEKESTFGNEAGMVYIYSGNSGSNWVLYDQISKERAGDRFGFSLKIFPTGNNLIVGSPYDNTITINGGSVSFFQNLNKTGYIENQKIIGQISNNNHNFGQSVSISNDGANLLVGAPNISSSGYAYIFTGTYDNKYALTSLLNRTNGQNADLFGSSTSLNKQGNIAAIGAPGYSSSRGAIYIFTGNSNNQWFQNAFITGTVNAPTEFGCVLKLNDFGDLLAVASYNNNPITHPNISGAIHLYSGSGDYKEQWIKIRTIDEITINGDSNLNLKSGLEFINNNNADLLFFSNYFSNTGYVQVVSNITQTGFIGYLTGSGIITINENNFLFTGSITGQRYIKTFFDSFNLITGYYLGGLLTGLQDFKINNYIKGNSYVNSGFISEDIDQLYIQAKTRNYFSNDVISGLLSISGYETGKFNNRVITTIITGIR